MASGQSPRGSLRGRAAPPSRRWRLWSRRIPPGALAEWSRAQARPGRQQTWQPCPSPPRAVPVAPDAVEQLHEGEGEVEAEEEEEVAGGPVGQDGPARGHAARQGGGLGPGPGLAPPSSPPRPSPEPARRLPQQVEARRLVLVVLDGEGQHGARPGGGRRGPAARRSPPLPSPAPLPAPARLRTPGAAGAGAAARALQRGLAGRGQRRVAGGRRGGPGSCRAQFCLVGAPRRGSRFLFPSVWA